MRRCTVDIDAERFGSLGLVAAAARDDPADVLLLELAQRQHARERHR
jgi:hypothetical protein